jgi:hypothetical protein
VRWRADNDGQSTIDYRVFHTNKSNTILGIMNSRMSRTGRAEAMNLLTQHAGLSQAGADWLTLRLDPYHDFIRPIAGYPDADSLDTVVSINNYELNVSQPALLGANWDAHIFTLPISSTPVINGTFNALLNFDENEEVFNLGLVNIAKSAAGEPLFPVADPVASANFSMTRVAVFNEVETGVSRVIGLGVEIIDTTAEIYKQGSLTAYQMPACTLDSSQVSTLNAGGDEQTQAYQRVLLSPPSLVTEAVLYRSSVQWEAKEGAYLSVGQEGINNPMKLNTREGLAILPNGLVAAGQALVSHNEITTVAQVPPLVTSSLPVGNYKTVNCTQSGIILSGLDTHATFKIRVRVYIERAPMRSETDLIPLATPSASYDPVALAIYSKVSAILPICVPVAFNAHGDWWRMIVNALKAVIPVAGGLLTPILGPEAIAIASGISALIPSQKIGKKNNERVARAKRIVKTVSAASKRAQQRGPI